MSITRPSRDRSAESQGTNSTRWIAFGVIGIVVIVLLFEAFGTVPAGFRGVTLRFGAPTGEVKQPGLYMITPFVTHVALVNVQIQAYHAEAIEAASADLQDVHTSVTVNYTIDPAHVIDSYVNFRNDVVVRILAPNVQESVKSATARFSAQQLIQERPRVKELTDKTLLDRVRPFWVVIDATSITQFQFSPSFTQAIEAKVAAEQNALTAQRNLERVKFEAQQQVERARAEAQALALQKAQITPALLQLRWIEKWNGVLPQVQSGQSMIPLLNLPAPKEGK